MRATTNLPLCRLGEVPRTNIDLELLELFAQGLAKGVHTPFAALLMSLWSLCRNLGIILLAFALGLNQSAVHAVSEATGSVDSYHNVSGLTQATESLEAL